MRSVSVRLLSLVPMLAACSGGGSDGAGTGTQSAQPSQSALPASSAVAGGAAKSSSAGAGAMSTPRAGSATTPGGTNSAAGGSGPAVSSTPAASSGASGASASAAGSSASGGAAGAAGAAAGTTPAMGMIECNGKPWPARAQGGYGPFPVGPESAGLPAYWPTQDWKMEDPEKLGFDAAKLKTAVDFTIPQTTNQAVLVIRHGYIAAEKYFGGFTQSTQHESYSMAKSFSSGLIGIAIAEGKIPSLDARVCEYYPDQWDCNDMKDPRSRITIDHAMNLKTGLRWSENWRSDSTGVNDGILTSLDTVLARDSVEEPGVRQRYSTGDPALLSGIIQKATGKTALAYAKEKVFDVIGVPGIRWNADNQGRTTTYAGLQATAREYAKYGYLYLNYGKWDGKQVVPMDYVLKTTQVHLEPCKEWVKYLWHVNPPTRLGIQPKPCDELFCQPTEYVDLPQDTFFAEGVQGQYIYIMPSRDLLIVRLGQDAIASEVWDDYSRAFLGKVLEAIK